MFWWSVDEFHRFDQACRIVLAVHPEYLERWKELFGEEEEAFGYKINLVAGGKSRIESVRNALSFIKKLQENEEIGENDLVYIHDAARPLVTPELISRGSKLVEKGIGAIPVVPLTDSIRRLDADGSSRSVERSRYVAVQTPQIFRVKDICAAYDKVGDESGFTDDASVAENNGMKIVTFPGEPSNIKVTTPFDFTHFCR